MTGLSIVNELLVGAECLACSITCLSSWLILICKAMQVFMWLMNFVPVMDVVNEG